MLNALYAQRSYSSPHGGGKGAKSFLEVVVYISFLVFLRPALGHRGERLEKGRK